MPLDKPKALDKYPASFWGALRAGEGRHVVVEAADIRDIQREARRFRAFLRGIKQESSGHLLRQALRDYHIRSQISWSEYSESWQLYAILSPLHPAESAPVSGDDALFTIMSRMVKGNEGGG